MSQQSLQQRIEAFLGGSPFAVAGASLDRGKYGNKVLRCYLQHGRRVFAINPSVGEVEGVVTHLRLSAIGEKIHGLSIVTPPRVTERIIDEAAALGIKHVWMQPGAESGEAIRRAEAAGMSVIAGGACLLVVLGFREVAGHD